jgi:transposase-like protein
MLTEVYSMSNKKPYYTPEYKAEAVRLARENQKPVSHTAKDIGLSESALRKWIRQADIDEGKGPEGALTTDEKAELCRLRRENRQIQMERDFLKKAAAFFARENS